ncbi:type II secretion system protein N [Roseateles sp.]|uniref:type II secretion system protein N n=1 Tax=Roseateles sp. TaxID=1971397 RepID=UPI002DFC3E00|nr:type II secretion system protein N [Roseateles sp.]
MLARLMALTVWLLLGGSVAYWGLQLLARPLPMPASVLPVGEARAAQVDLGRLLGVTPPQAAAEPEAAPSTRLRLLGVVAPKNPRAAQAGEGVALIEVDGVARTVRVGAVVDGELRLLRVEARTASLGRAGQAPSQVLQISPPAAPATGSLPAASPSPVVLGGNPPGTVTTMSAAVPPPSAGQVAPPPAHGVPYGVPLAASAPGGAPQER